MRVYGRDARCSPRAGTRTRGAQAPLGRGAFYGLRGWIGAALRPNGKEREREGETSELSHTYAQRCIRGELSFRLDCVSLARPVLQARALITGCICATARTTASWRDRFCGCQVRQLCVLLPFVPTESTVRVRVIVPEHCRVLDTWPFCNPLP